MLYHFPPSIRPPPLASCTNTYTHITLELLTVKTQDTHLHEVQVQSWADT